MKTGGFGPSGETRTRGILVPNQAPYQLGHTRILSYEKMLVVVKYVVKGIVPQFYPTFNGDKSGISQSNRGVSNIWSDRTNLVFLLPKQARYQLRYTWIKLYFSLKCPISQGEKQGREVVCYL